MAQKQWRVGLCGWGTVAQAFYRLCTEQAAWIAQQSGIRIEITAVGSRREAEGCAVPQYRDLMEVAAMGELDAVVELIGGVDTAMEIAEKTLRGGRHFVTANKALLASQGEQLGRWAAASSVRIGAEAAVAGAIPVLRTLRGPLLADRIEEISGILNGTCNYIISSMEDGKSFDDALAEAQEKGFAEADPTLDLDGSDAAQKIAILAHVAFGAPIDEAAVSKSGLTQLQQLDIRAAADLGFRCRHLATARRSGNQVAAKAALVLVPVISPLARIRGETNAVLLRCNAAGEQMLQGAGAGGLPTASAVLADLVDIARQPEVAERIGQTDPDLSLRPARDEACRRYLRLELSDQPGALSDLTACFAENGINIEAVEQHPGLAGASRQVVFLLGPSSDDTMARVRAQMAQMSAASPPLQLRIEEELH